MNKLKQGFESFFLKPVAWVVLAVIYFVMILFMVKGGGGIDLEAYRLGAEVPFDEWGGYYYKEFVSWGVIKFSYFVSGVLGIQSPVLVLNVVLAFFLLPLLRSKEFLVGLYPIVLVAPLSVLLVFNVLRQYVALFFFIMAVVSVLRGARLSFYVFCVLALFSHNSMVFFVLLAVSCLWFSLSVVCVLVFIVQAMFFFVAVPLGVGGGVFGEYTQNSEVMAWVKVLANFLYAGILFLVIIYLSRYGVGWLSSRFFRKLIITLFLFSVVSVMFPWPFWVVNRFLIYISFVFLFFSVVGVRNGFKSFSAKFWFLMCLLFFNVIALLGHRGAVDMLKFISTEYW